MKMRNCGRVSLLLTLFLIVPQQAAATTALYSLSYGTRSAGMAGAPLASGGDALNQFLNPANLSFLPKRLDLNITYNIQYRALATRYDKRAVSFLGAVHLAASVILLN